MFGKCVDCVPDVGGHNVLLVVVVLLAASVSVETQRQRFILGKAVNNPLCPHRYKSTSSQPEKLKQDGRESSGLFGIC